MTEQEQRIAIANTCGWKAAKEDRDLELHIPDYLNDLNAMNEAEQDIRGQWNEYFEQLISIRWRDAQPDRHPADLSPAGATASQRAEALLKTLNLWK